MAVDYRFKFPLPNGLHARPASHFEAVSSQFRSAITLIHERTLYRANTRSVLSMVSADVKFDDLCCIHVDGDDEQSALEAVRRFLVEQLPHCDQALPELPGSAGELILPRSLKATGLTQYLRGKAVCGGVGWGTAVIIGALEMPKGFEQDTFKHASYESEKANSAIAAVSGEIQEKIKAATHSQEIQVLKAHASIIRDVGLSDMIATLIASERRTAAQAIAAACSNFSDTLRNSQNAYLRERVLDIEDICIQLLNKVVNHPASAAYEAPQGGCASGHSLAAGSNGNGHARKSQGLTEASICVADHLTPGQFLALDRRWLRGLVLRDGGTTSHTVILARSMNIPTLVGVPASSTVVTGGEILLDGNLGLLVKDITEPIRRYYTMERDRLDHRRRKLESFRNVEGMTADHHAVEVGANIASAEEAAVAFETGAQGIGLFRTEMLFMDRSEAPSEQEQTQIYTAAVEAAKGRPIIIRLLDIGGDKPVPYLKLPAEGNPFLGYRGARLYNEFSELVKTQLRAILHASTPGANIKILVPMVCCMEEVRLVRRLLNEAADELVAAEVSSRKVPPLGMMIEIPALAFLMPELCEEVDFFSIGSNDLIQYFLAADRENQKVASIYKWSHPAFLRVLKSIVDQAHAHGKWVGLCGEMGDDPAVLPLLIGLGLDEISVSSARVGLLKAAIADWHYSLCQQLTSNVLKCSTREEVESLAQSAPALMKAVPLFCPELIFRVDAKTKEEVIKQLADRLYVAGRVAEPRLLEEAIWNREDTYSTGFGHGFALPHCKSDHLTANSLIIAKLSTPIEWGSLDGKPVDVVFLVAIREKDHGQAHMKIFANLSRLVMREEFRDQIRSQSDPDQLTAVLNKSLRLDPASSS